VCANFVLEKLELVAEKFAEHTFLLVGLIVFGSLFKNLVGE
jgi:hypothetical protein